MEENNIPKKVLSMKELEQQLSDFKGEVHGALDRIVSMLENKIESPAKPEEEAKQADGALGVLPPQYEVIFTKYFDRADGFSAELDYLTRNSFAIFVPLKFSNATQAYLEFYKRDVRSKMLKGDDIAGGIEAWCKLVARNLHYDRTKQTK